MIDFHSHILPGMDDGAKTLDDSLELLRMTEQQRISGIVATPHFYPDKEEPDVFLERRRKAMHDLYKALTPSMPEVYVGAEVAYFGGMGRSEQMRRLTVKGTHTILVEMPFSPWSEQVLKDMRGLSDNLGLLPVIAHIERYMAYQNREMLYRLTDLGVRIQSNADFFTRFLTRRRAVTMLARNEIQFIGSDCHNTSSRPQTLGKALETIEERLGSDMIDYITETTELQLNGAIPLRKMFETE